MTTLGAFEVPPDLLETLDEQAARQRAELATQQRRERAKRLCSLAAVAVDALRAGGKLGADVEAAIHDVGDAVLALDAYERIARVHGDPTREQKRAAGAVVELPAVGWALDQVAVLVRRHEAAEAERKRR
jgi:hypothetical protein